MTTRARRAAGRKSVLVHATAIVERGSRVGAGTRIWHHAHVMPGARIGRDCVLGQGVFVGGAAVLGDRCHVQNHVSIFDAVTLGDAVFVGPAATFTNVRTPRVEFPRKGRYVPTTVGRGASIGANATVVCGVALGEYCLVGAGAVVTRDVPAHALVVGVPARRVGWACRCGERLARRGRLWGCEGCGDSYTRRGSAFVPRAPRPRRASRVADGGRAASPLT